MAIELVSLAKAKAHLRVTQIDDDTYIRMLIVSASASVIAYLKDGADVFLDSDGQLIDDDSIAALQTAKIATLFLVGVHFNDREGSGTQQFDGIPSGYLPAPVTNLLYPFRDPAWQ